MFGLASIPAVLQVLLVINMPKSPRFLLLKNKENEVKKKTFFLKIKLSINAIFIISLKHKKFAQ